MGGDTLRLRNTASSIAFTGHTAVHFPHRVHFSWSHRICHGKSLTLKVEGVMGRSDCISWPLGDLDRQRPYPDAWVENLCVYLVGGWRHPNHIFQKKMHTYRAYRQQLRVGAFCDPAP